MKQVGCLLGGLLVVAVVVAGFFALVSFSLTNVDDQRALTREVPGTVVAAQRYRGDQGSRSVHKYAITYTYQLGGRTYRGEDWIGDRNWRPGQPLPICVDPEKPREHLVRIESDPCGSKSVNHGHILTGTPTTPAGR